MTFFDLADPGFSVTSDQVHRAREDGWYARTSYGLAVLRHDQAGRLIRHPSLRQGSAAWPAHHGITSGPFADWWAGWVLTRKEPIIGVCASCGFRWPSRRDSSGPAAWHMIPSAGLQLALSGCGQQCKGLKPDTALCRADQA